MIGVRPFPERAGARRGTPAALCVHAREGRSRRWEISESAALFFLLKTFGFASREAEALTSDILSRRPSKRVVFIYGLSEEEVEIGRMLGVGAVMEATLTGDSSAATLSLMLLRVATGKEETVTRTLVDVAGESAAEVRVYVAHLFGRKRELPAGSLTLVPAGGSTDLSGAEIRLDDHARELDALRKVPAGAHRLEVRKPGDQAFVWQGQVHPGRETKVPVALEPVPAPMTEKRPASEPAKPPPTEPLPKVRPRPEPKAPETQVASQADKGGGPRVFTLISSGAAVAAGVVGTIFGVQKLSLDSEIRQDRDPRQADGSLPGVGLLGSTRPKLDPAILGRGASAEGGISAG